MVRQIQALQVSMTLPVYAHSHEQLALGDPVETEHFEYGFKAPYDESDWEDAEKDEVESTEQHGKSPSRSGVSEPPLLGAHAPGPALSPLPSTHEPEDEQDAYQVPPHFDSTGNSFRMLKEWHPAVVLTSLLVSWLHLSGHLSFRLCDTVLTIVGYILMAVGQQPLVASLYGSLKGTLKALRLEPHFRTLPVCPACCEVYPESILANPLARCKHAACRHPLFRLEPTAAERRKGQSSRQNPRPWLQFPYKSLVEQLSTILALPGVEEAMDVWRKRTQIQGWLGDIFDGRICHALCGPDGQSFFRYDLRDGGPEGELRIGLTLGVDW